LSNRDIPWHQPGERPNASDRDGDAHVNMCTQPSVSEMRARLAGAEGGNVRVYQYMPEELGNPIVFKKIDGLLRSLKEDLENSEVGDVYTVEIVEMTQHALEHLPEHQGW